MPEASGPAVQKSRPSVETVLGLRSERPSRLLWRRAAMWAGIAVVILGAAYGVWSLSGGQAAVSYVTEPAARGPLTVTVTATGAVQPTKKVTISSELSGTIRNVYVDYNSQVAVGQVLADLDTDKLNATVRNSRAKLNAARARVAEAAATIVEKRAEYERKRALAATSVASAADLDAAKAAYDRSIASHASALADVETAEADLALNETNLAKADIRSPIRGVVLTRNVDPGQTVASSLQAPVLFVIAEDLAEMELQVDVDEADVGKVSVGQNASFAVDAYPDRKFPAVIRDVRYGSEIVQGVVTYKAVLTIDNAELLLRPGMTATADITVQQIADALLVANAALRFTPPAAEPQASSGMLSRLLPFPRMQPPRRPAEDASRRNVWVLRDGAPVAVPVVAGASDGRRTEIVQGELAPGAPVIVGAATVKR
jgi:HlyD family secretion protein